MLPRVLIIAGSDSGGGAGIQADIKTVSALGGYAMTAVTALTAQNTQGVFGIQDIPSEFVAKQIELTLSDIGADAIKTGMLFSADIIHTITGVLKRRAANIPLVLDPVMIAKGGSALLAEDAVAALTEELMPAAALITPNIPEAEFLAGQKITSVHDMHFVAEKLCANGARAVLIKGGHMEGAELTDVLLDEVGKIHLFPQKRIQTQHTHGTGCTYASAIATYLGKGEGLVEAVKKAQAYVHGAITRAPGFGKGHGPIHHGWIHEK